MAIISDRELNDYYQSKIRNRGTSKVASLINESKNPKGYSFETLVFLSHKHDEKDEVKKAIVLLREHGSAVYVDWLDSSMPSTTSAATAINLKYRINKANKFVLLATERAINSKWCNWELGIGDGYKSSENIALLPVREYAKTYSGSEYLQIYPHIENDNGIFYVNNSKGELIKLREWLN